MPDKRRLATTKFPFITKQLVSWNILIVSALLSMFRIRMVLADQLFGTNNLPTSLWTSKSYENGNQRVSVSKLSI